MSFCHDMWSNHKLTIVVDSVESGFPPMEEALTELERVQTQLLQRISKLEQHSHLPQQTISSTDDTVTHLSSILLTNGVDDFSFKRVPSDYYDWPLEARRDALGAESIDHLCKSIVLVNTQAPSNVIDCSDRKNSKYYVVVVQYTARFNAEAVRNFLYSLNNGSIAKKKFNLRLAPEEISAELTGYGHNAVTCIGMKTNIPGVLSYLISWISCLHLVTATVALLLHVDRGSIILWEFLLCRIHDFTEHLCNI